MPRPETRLFDDLPDGVVVGDHQDRIRYANAAAARLLGWAADELVGQELTVLIPPRLHAAHLAGIARYVATGQPRILGRALRLPARRRDDSEVDIELTLATGAMDGADVFVGVLRDPANRPEPDDQGVAARLVQVLAEAQRLDEAAPEILAAVGAGLGWDVAELWVVDPERQQLRWLALWARPDLPVSTFRRDSHTRAFAKGEGLPGAVWAAGKPQWIDDVRTEALFPRAASAAADELCTGFAFPVAGDRGVLAVIELFTRQRREPDIVLQAQMATIGRHLGRFVERMLAEEALGLSRQRLDLALDAGGMGTWEWDADSRMATCSASLARIVGLGDEDVTFPLEEYFERIVHPDDRELLRSAMSEAFKSRTSCTVQHRFVHPERGPRWLEVHGRAFDEATRRRGMAGVGADVTERVQAREGERAALRDLQRALGEQVRVARALQDSLLPPRLPNIPGAELAARFRPAGEGLVSGDFYDVFPISSQGWALVIGDVRGKGAEAAAVTALARHTVQAATMHAGGPAEVLATLNAAMLRRAPEDPEKRFATIAFASLHPVPQGMRVTVASGGHPLPLIVRSGGCVEAVGGPGMLVGAFEEAVFTQAEAVLAPGDLLVGYTDGITEARMAGGELFGEQRLAEVLATCAGASAEETATRLRESVSAAHLRDDLAVLVLRVLPAH